MNSLIVRAQTALDSVGNPTEWHQSGQPWAEDGCTVQTEQDSNAADVIATTDFAFSDIEPDYDAYEARAAFIAGAPALIRALVAEIARLEALLVDDGRENGE